LKPLALIRAGSTQLSRTLEGLGARGCLERVSGERAVLGRAGENGLWLIWWRGDHAGMSTGPPAVGRRLAWEALPEVLREAVERRLGARVVRAATQPGGFSPGVAARLGLDGGGRAFVKAVGPHPNADSPNIHRAEAVIAAALPADTPSPRLLESFEHDGWVVLLFEDVDGKAPTIPWVASELTRVLETVTELAAALTPTPVRAPSVEERFGEQFQGWRRLRETGDERLDPWAARNLDFLAAVEADWAVAAKGSTLAHADLRADNLLLTDDRVFVVDWPWACVAAPWFDLVQMLPSVRMQGGPPPEEIFAAHPLGRAADEGAVTAVLVALTGFLVYHSLQPPPPGLPTLREFQRAQGVEALDWVKDRTGG
jgi:hypothetical protein